MKISFSGKAYVQAGGVFVRQRLEGDVTDTKALGMALAIAFEKALGADFLLLHGGASKLPIATIIVDLSANVDAQDSLKGMVQENSLQQLHVKGQLPRPNMASQTTPLAATSPSKNGSH